MSQNDGSVRQPDEIEVPMPILMPPSGPEAKSVVGMIEALKMEGSRFHAAISAMKTQREAIELASGLSHEDCFKMLGQVIDAQGLGQVIDQIADICVRRSLALMEQDSIYKQEIMLWSNACSYLLRMKFEMKSFPKK